MERRRSSRADQAVLGVQLGGAIVVLLALAVVPPAQGNMLLVPMTREAPAVALAVAAGGLVIASAPRGAVVVRGRRDRLIWPLLRAGVLTLAAPEVVCGTERDK